MHSPNSTVLIQQSANTRKAPEGHYLHVQTAFERFAALYLGDRLPARPVMAVVSFDHLLDDRMETIRRFASALESLCPQPDPRLTGYRRSNLRQMLQVVDGREAGATFQEIAEVVFGTRRVSATTWKSMPERDTIMRRYREGMKLVQGGYRWLLVQRRTRSLR